jgi:folate-binding protein YgfZ
MDQALVSPACAPLTTFGALAVRGPDARAFLHAQLTNDVEHLPADRARRAGWCSAKGRLLASFVVIPCTDGFLLQVARDLAFAVAKRLAMFVLRSKVTVVDVSNEYRQIGMWGAGTQARIAACGLSVPAGDLAIARVGEVVAVRMGEERFLVLGPTSQATELEGRLDLPPGPESSWMLAEIRAGRPLIVQATQDLFVPQMVNLESIGGVDFKKGCYPGQEIVARTQYRGQLKRRMVRVRAPAGVALVPAQDLYGDDIPGQVSGTVVNAAPADGGSELLAVVPVGASEGRPLRATPDGPLLDVLDLPYSS